jgi:hypothetical protein
LRVHPLPLFVAAQERFYSDEKLPRFAQQGLSVGCGQVQSGLDNHHHKTKEMEALQV